MNGKLYQFDDMVWEPVSEGVKRKVVAGDGVTVAYYIMMPGSAALIHHHSHSQLVFLMNGEGIVTMGDTSQPMQGPSVCHFPSNLPHSLTINEESAPAYVYDVFTPRRTEYEESYKAYAAAHPDGEK